MRDLEERIIQLVNSTINAGLSIKNMQDDLQQIGMNSIKFIEIIILLEETFEIEIPDEKLLIAKMNTLNQIIDAVSIALSKKEKQFI